MILFGLSGFAGFRWDWCNIEFLWFWVRIRVLGLVLLWFRGLGGYAWWAGLGGLGVISGLLCSVAFLGLWVACGFCGVWVWCLGVVLLGFCCLCFGGYFGVFLGVLLCCGVGII